MKFAPKNMAQVDCDVMAEEVPKDIMTRDILGALRQGEAASAREARILFRSPYSFEASLKIAFASELPGAPKVGIFQGKLDQNVPFKHSKFVQDELLHGKAKFVTYEDLGHISLAARKADVYARFVIPT
jgi:fermentation-respiration switch protein FrsA (DUF1100 family)